MSRTARPSSLVAPGVHRLGDHVVNFYAVEEPDGVVLVDSGLPSHLGQVREVLDAAGKSLSDVRAVLLTHAHPDHTGLAATLQKAGAVVRVHEGDAAILRDGPRSAMRHAKPERSMLPYLLRRPAAAAVPLHLARKGAFTAPATPGAESFREDGPLEGVPGKPLAIGLPGHTPGSAAYFFAERGLLFTGDALVTYDGLTGLTGPGLVCRGFTHASAAALAALDRLDGIGSAALVLPGHGEPFSGGIQEATRQARRTGLH
jgi:glyoxylase-like metal-dependent hydrolase (beta-lactamase superfamily II)